MRIDTERLAELSEQLHAELEENHYKRAAAIARNLSSPRVADTLTQFPPEVAGRLLGALPPLRAGRVASHLPADYNAQLIPSLPQAISTRLLNHIPADQLNGVLESLRQEDREKALTLMAPEKRAFAMAAARYEPDAAGRVMSPHFITVPAEMLVRTALQTVLDAPPEVERTPYLYVHDSRDRLVGVVSIKDLLRTAPDAPVKTIMNTTPVMVRTTDPALDAATLIRNRRFTMLPVVNEYDQVNGIITFDDAMAIHSRETSRMITAAGAVTVEESFFTPPTKAIKGRLPWMAANIFLNMGAVAIITGFEETIATVAILAAFIPMITDMGGNVGIQSLSVAIRSLALGEARLRDLGKVLRKEVVIGMVNGVALGLLFAVIAFFLQGNAYLALLAGVALSINVLVAGLVGGALPFLVRAVGKDPAMMTGPVLTTITDITGVSIYLGLATAFIFRLST